MSEDFRERLDRLDRMASAAPRGLLDHRATLDLRVCLVRPGPQAGRAIPVRPAPQAPPVSAVLLERPALPARLDPQVARAQQEQRALLVRRD
ncbi:hypothetical protein SAMN04487843_108210 [Methylobacterium sp. ap11]|nr:hypothetical protein SAMN04487843_108210 [Methylobacterium sp. ap11]